METKKRTKEEVSNAVMVLVGERMTVEQFQNAINRVIYNYASSTIITEISAIGSISMEAVDDLYTLRLIAEKLEI